jgi:NAD(P)-dependent dehydrogenase (short-subunit alcohol dehydrogenase family)
VLVAGWVGWWRCTSLVAGCPWLLWPDRVRIWTPSCPPQTAVIVQPVDVADRAAVAEAFAAAVDRAGPPATLVTCAGSIDGLGPVAEVDADQWWSGVAVDLRGTMLTAQEVLRWMLPLRRGRIVTVYGNLGDRGQPNLSAFAVAKAGVARFTETLANELAGTGVIVIGMHPGFVRSPMTEHLAWSDEGRRWLPSFSEHAERHWGTGQSAVALVDQILNAAADTLAGRVIHSDDNLGDLARRAAASPDRRFLRIQWAAVDEPPTSAGDRPQSD